MNCPYCQSPIKFRDSTQMQCETKDHKFWSTTKPNNNYWFIVNLVLDIYVDCTGLYNDIGPLCIFKYPLTMSAAAQTLKKFNKIKAFL